MSKSMTLSAVLIILICTAIIVIMVANHATKDLQSQGAKNLAGTKWISVTSESNTETGISSTEMMIFTSKTQVILVTTRVSPEFDVQVITRTTGYTATQDSLFWLEKDTMQHAAIFADSLIFNPLEADITKRLFHRLHEPGRNR